MFQKKYSFSQKVLILFLVGFVLVTGGILGLPDKVHAAPVFGTSTPMVPGDPALGGKIIENSENPVLRIDLNTTSTSAENLDSVAVTVSTTTNAIPTSTATSSFEWVGVVKDMDEDGACNLPFDALLATSTISGFSTTTLIDIASVTTTSATGTFFVLLKTSDTWTDNNYPDDTTAMYQAVRVSIAANGVIASTTASINATETQPFIADTHSQAPATSSLAAFYQESTYYLQEQDGQTLGEQGTARIYATQATTTPLVQVPLSPGGHPSGPISLGPQYRSSIWLDLVDVFGHPASARVQYNLPSQPAITSFKAFTDRIIFNTNKNLDGSQAMDCSNYKVNDSTLNCAGPGYPFIDFFGNQVVIRDLSLTASSTATLQISGTIQDINHHFPFPDNYSTSSVVVAASIPVISSVTPSSATTGASVVITGSNFGSATGTVLFSGGFSQQTGPLPPVEASTTAWSATSITAVVPAGTNSGPVQVVTSEGIVSDMNENSFFDVLTNVYFKIVDSTSTNPIEASTNMGIFVGSPQGENLYFVGDTHGTSFDGSTYVYTVPNVSSKGFAWAFDASGTYRSSPGNELSSNTSSTNPQILTLQGTTTAKVSGTITLGTTCTSQGQHQMVAAMAMPEGVEVEMGPGGPQPSFFITGPGCTTTYALALPEPTATSTFRVETHLPPSATSTLLMDPSAQLVTVSGANPTPTANFTFTQADRKIYGQIVGENNSPLSPQKYQELWIFASQPKAEGKSSVGRANSQGYFSLYVTEGVYKIGVSGPMMPFPVEKDITVDSSLQFATDTTSTSIIIKLAPPTTYIEGYVKDGAGNGISNVDIFSWCEGGPGGGHAFTDSQGYYKMYVSPCSNYHVGGFAENYGDLEEQTKIGVTQSSNPTVNFTLSSANFVTVSGTVTKNGSALSNIDVWITQGEFGEGRGWSRSDSTGAYSIRLRKNLKNLWLHAASPGQGEIYLGQLNSGNALDASTTVPISASTTIIEIHLKPGNTFNDVFLSANSSIGHGSTDVRVSTSSQYDVYKIEVPYSGTTSYTIDGGIPGFGPIPATTTVVSGNTTITVDLTGQYYTVSGTVTATGTLATSTDAFVWAGGPNGGGGTKVASDGTFSMKLRQGTYDIGVGKTGYTGSILKSQSIATTTSGLSLTLTKNTSSISGTVKYGSTNISNAKVWADNGAGGWSGTVSEADGSFILNVSPGEWKVSAVAEGYRLENPLRITAPASGITGITLNLSAVDFNPERKKQSIKPVEGGVIQTSDTRVEVPAGALGSDSTETGIEIQNTMEVSEAKGAKIISSKAKEITASYSTGDNKGQTISVLNKSITIETVMTKAELTTAGISSISGAQKMKLAYDAGTTVSNWVELPTTVILNPSDATWNTLTSITLKATTQHLSKVAPESPASAAPPTPTGLTATAGDSQVSLSWSGSSDATKYDIYRWDGAHYKYLTQTLNTSYTDTGLTNGTTYSYEVSALNDADQESAATEAVSATPVASVSASGGSISVSNLGDTIPPSISGIKVSAGDTFATITWQTNEASISWILYGTSTDYGLEASSTTSTTSHSLTLTGLSASTTYHYQIKSKDSADNIGSYTDKTFTTLKLGEQPEVVPTTTQKAAAPTKPISQMTIGELKAEIARITALIAQLQKQLLKLAPQKIQGIPAGFTFQKNLSYGMSNQDVVYLKIVLSNQGCLSGLKNTKWFGPKTKKGVQCFCQKYKDEISEAAGYPVKCSGFVGKGIRTELDQLLGR